MNNEEENMKEKFYKEASVLYEKGIFELLNMGTMFALCVNSDTYYCVVEDNSIFMYKNKRGFESWLELIDQEDEVSDLRALELEYMKYGLSLSFSDFEDLSKYEIKELKQLEIDYREMSQIPRFRHHDELSLPFRVKEDDFSAINTLLITLNDILENNYTLFDEDQKFLEEDENIFEEEELEDIINMASIDENNNVLWTKVELPDEFDRYPSPALNEREAYKYRKMYSNNNEWNFHLFIIPNANENKSHLFPIACIIYIDESKKILSYNLARDYDKYCDDFLVDLLDIIYEMGRPKIINVATDRAESLISTFCKQLDIEVSRFDSFEETDNMEVQLIKNYNY